MQQRLAPDGGILPTAARINRELAGIQWPITNATSLDSSPLAEALTRFLLRCSQHSVLSPAESVLFTGGSSQGHCWSQRRDFHARIGIRISHPFKGVCRCIGKNGSSHGTACGSHDRRCATGAPAVRNSLSRSCRRSRRKSSARTCCTRTTLRKRLIRFPINNRAPLTARDLRRLKP